MMNKKTERVLTAWMNENIGKVVSSGPAEVDNERVAWDTVMRYVHIEPVIKRYYYSVKELVGLLNSCAGEDCYCADWHFEIDDNGKVFTDELVGYIVKGWR